ncbi:MAG: glycosyltransferase family 2 protein [Candidatus Aminicenantes bacterium]|nr:glycosyltransferase family 2 protein [Candidatus Aminicenantes bacterium]MDH5384813.1 glycosyltransferase family 2 protein [Candidatus Aminicenantes bacterium]MDH5743909.1 glycosyltransferase family 2 protein [Candidatus Aminicenantes bacterium]
MEKKSKKVVVVMPAYNAEKTLEKTLNDIPRDWVDDIILTDDASQDNTVELAKKLGLRVFVHDRNKGYGGNQKTCYREALNIGADIMIMIHPDHQYDPTVIPQLLEPLLDEECDAVFGSRMLGGRPLEGGMPKWKYLANIFLTATENAVFYMYLTEYHSGLRAYSRRYLETVKFEMNSDDFVFDSEIIAQGVIHNMRIKEIPIETRYFPEASRIGLWRSIIYGLSILKTLVKYKLHKKGIKRFEMFN